VVDNIQRGSMDVRGIKTLILDEVDVMLDIGFVDACREVIQSLNPDCQVVCVSATFPTSVYDLCQQILRDPINIVVPVEEIQLGAITQFYVDCGSHDAKIDVLLDLYGTLSAGQSIVFVNSRRRAMEVADEMDRADHTVSVIHGELEQHERDLTLKEFKQGASRVLIATDILGRGFDCQQVSLVLNVDLPHEKENYIHRIGRCGRQGRKGVAINLIDSNSRDVGKLHELEQFYAINIDEMPADPLAHL
jgi:translation initiation factor 4A